MNKKRGERALILVGATDGQFMDQSLRNKTDMPPHAEPDRPRRSSRGRAMLSTLVVLLLVAGVV